jgi:hypothetical protein
MVCFLHAEQQTRTATGASALANAHRDVSAASLAIADEVQRGRESEPERRASVQPARFASWSKHFETLSDRSGVSIECLRKNQ